ncbi:putative steryl acetyl hydrolase [Lyophyllum shimeji]|uniref:Steryl acetyl hydrolase n=1 Tax=Lyophyllum shimeji TaxID=47721 RepID=A0A9P3PKS7_LYOSH|nr:putative steryl acetyl hydrolase [Lyophyllum shimeji]
MQYPFRRQPLKAAYLTYQVLTTLLLRIPLWVLLAIPRPLRPRASWSVKRTVFVNFVRHFLNISARSGPVIILPNHLAITPGENVNGVWLDPAPQLVTGKLQTWMHATSVTPSRIPGYWIHRKGSTIEVAAAPKPGEKVLYNLHGGAYIRLSAHPSDVTANIPRGIVEHVASIQRAFSLEYRLSSHKPFTVAHPFPAALLDALAGYSYLINVVGFAPADIILAGDSAGGNLAHALTRYLVEHQASDNSIPALPGGLILLSPWCDLSPSHEGPGSSSVQFISSDYIHPTEGGGDYAKEAFLGPLGLGAAGRNPYISPASKDPSMQIDFKGFPRTFIVAGGAEVLYDQIVTLKDRMAKDLGDQLTYYEAKDGIHDYLVFRWHEPERTDTMKAIAKWVDTL